MTEAQLLQHALGAASEVLRENWSPQARAAALASRRRKALLRGKPVGDDENLDDPEVRERWTEQMRHERSQRERTDRRARGVTKPQDEAAERERLERARRDDRPPTASARGVIGAMPPMNKVRDSLLNKMAASGDERAKAEVARRKRDRAVAFAAGARRSTRGR